MMPLVQNATLTSGFEVTLWKQKCYQSLLPEVSNSRVLKLKENHDLELSKKLLVVSCSL